VTRGVDDLLEDLAEAADAAAELVSLGKGRWDSERLLRLAGEAVIGRLGDIATKLPDEVIKGIPEVPWREVKGMRIIAAHAYHRIDYQEVWITLRDDVPRMDQAIKRWRHAQAWSCQTRAEIEAAMITLIHVCPAQESWLGLLAAWTHNSLIMMSRAPE
jgi:uncharacterized protein with HEPN domain